MADKKAKVESYGSQRRTFAGGPGPGNNFYHGKDLGTHSRGSLGTRGADSNFSRRMQALVPSDYYELTEDEEEVNEIDEDVVVENSRYSLTKTLELNERAMRDLFLDLGGDLASAGLAAIPGFGNLASAAFAGWNIKQLSDDLQESKVAVEAFKRSQSDEILERMQEKFDDIGINLVDLLQRILELLPDLESPTAELISVGSSFATNLPKVANLINRLYSTGVPVYKKMLTLLKNVGLRSGPASAGTSTADALRRATEARTFYRKATTHGIVIPVMKFIIEAMDAGLAPEEVIRESGIVRGSANMMILLADLLEDYYIQKEAYLLAVGDMEDPPPFIYQHRILGASDRIEDYSIEDSSPDPLPPPSTDYVEYSDSLEPAPEDVTPPAPLGPDSFNTGEFIRKLFLTSPDDEGLFSESLSAMSLQYLIEEKDDELTEEDLEEEDITEFSGAGGGAIAIGTLPLGMSTKGPKGERSATSGGKAFPYSKKNRDAFKQYARKTFGGK